MDTTVILALIGGLPLILTSIATLWNSIKINQKADIIHTLVNSNLTAVKADLALANQRIESLQKLVSELVADRSAVAAAATVNDLRDKQELANGSN